MKPTGSAAKSGRSRDLSDRSRIRAGIETRPASSFVRVALALEDCGVDLERGKVYRVLPDRAAAADKYLRVQDESGDDYLYPARSFRLLRIPSAQAERLFHDHEPGRGS